MLQEEEDQQSASYLRIILYNAQIQSVCCQLLRINLKLLLPLDTDKHNTYGKHQVVNEAKEKLVDLADRLILAG